MAIAGEIFGLIAGKKKTIFGSSQGDRSYLITVVG
jgi:hypothetical protein